MVPGDYEPMDHADWEPGDLIVNVRSGGHAFVSERKTGADANPFDGWWVVTWPQTSERGGGVADFAKDWRSIKCLLAERQHYGL